jgi:hypothetical protein
MGVGTTAAGTSVGEDADDGPTTAEVVEAEEGAAAEVLMLVVVTGALFGALVTPAGFALFRPSRRQASASPLCAAQSTTRQSLKRHVPSTHSHPAFVASRQNASAV